MMENGKPVFECTMKLRFRLAPIGAIAFLTALLVVLMGAAFLLLWEVSNISMYSDTPITIDCAYRAVAAVDGVTSAEQHKYAIAFEGWLFSGQLFHGTEGEPFTRYGLDVSTSWLSGDDTMAIAIKVGESLRDICGT